TAVLRRPAPGPGDRYLLGAAGVAWGGRGHVTPGVWAAPAAPGAAVRELVALANGSGGPDNVSCVVADVVSGA
ncbi:hypothetical protein ACFWIU_38420, partial [Streptomyces sp. NPDC127039]